MVHVELRLLRVFEHLRRGSRLRWYDCLITWYESVTAKGIDNRSIYTLAITCESWVSVSILVASVLIPPQTLECDKSLLVVIQSVAVHAMSVCPETSYIVSRTVVVGL
jgi:hypothetical protein